jgi:hypothetical protein
MNANPQEPPEPDPGVTTAEQVEPESPRDRRRRLLAELRKERGSDVLIAYVTSTRPALEAGMAQDAIRPFFDHLPSEPVKQLDLVIHSNGGDGVVPWRLMTLLHEYAEKVDVLVPHRAFSAATLAALGAHEIVMHPMGMLGPIDASIVNPLGPVDNMSGQRVPVSGEDWRRTTRSCGRTSGSDTRRSWCRRFVCSPRTCTRWCSGASSEGAHSRGCWARS